MGIFIFWLWIFTLSVLHFGGQVLEYDNLPLTVTSYRRCTLNVR